MLFAKFGFDTTEKERLIFWQHLSRYIQKLALRSLSNVLFATKIQLSLGKCMFATTKNIESQHRARSLPRPLRVVAAPDTGATRRCMSDNVQAPKKYRFRVLKLVDESSNAVYCAVFFRSPRFTNSAKDYGCRSNAHLEELCKLLHTPPIIKIQRIFLENLWIFAKP